MYRRMRSRRKLQPSGGIDQQQHDQDSNNNNNQQQQQQSQQQQKELEMQEGKGPELIRSLSKPPADAVAAAAVAAVAAGTGGALGKTCLATITPPLHESVCLEGRRASFLPNGFVRWSVHMQPS